MSLSKLGAHSLVLSWLLSEVTPGLVDQTVLELLFLGASLPFSLFPRRSLGNLTLDRKQFSFSLGCGLVFLIDFI